MPNPDCLIVTREDHRVFAGPAPTITMTGSRFHDLATAFAVLESATINRPVSIDDVLRGAIDTYQAEIDTHYGLTS